MREPFSGAFGLDCSKPFLDPKGPKGKFQDRRKRTTEMAGGDVFSFVTFLFVQAKEKLIGVQGRSPATLSLT
jgi:hypothetical protein